MSKEFLTRVKTYWAVYPKQVAGNVLRLLLLYKTVKMWISSAKSTLSILHLCFCLII